MGNWKLVWYLSDIDKIWEKSYFKSTIYIIIWEEIIK